MAVIKPICTMDNCRPKVFLKPVMIDGRKNANAYRP